MTGFNRMTLAAAAEVLCDWKSHSELELMDVQWGITGRCNRTSKPARAADLARIALEEDLSVMTEDGSVSLGCALVEAAIAAPPGRRESEAWRRMVVGLRFDGFEIRSVTSEEDSGWLGQPAAERWTLGRMLPADVPGTDFREAQSEVERLLEQHQLLTARGHLERAVSAFNRGEWSSANGELRNLMESCLNEIAHALGFRGDGDSKAKRDYLGKLDPPFLLERYNEWIPGDKRHPFVQALMSRLHPEGGHSGLSEEEDATFRLQLVLITVRLFLRRFDQRVTDGR